MRFPNAHKGISRIFLAEIINLIGIIPTVIAAILFASFEQELTAENLMESASGVTIVVCAIISLVLTIAAAVINLIGYVNASRDEYGFKKALIFMIASAILSVTGSLMESSAVPGILTNTVNSMAQLLELFVTLFTIFALISLSVQYNDLAMIQRGTSLYKILFLIYIPSIFAYFLIRIFHDSRAAAFLAIAMAVIDAVLSMIYYVLYLSYLVKAKRMLET